MWKLHRGLSLEHCWMFLHKTCDSTTWLGPLLATASTSKVTLIASTSSVSLLSTCYALWQVSCSSACFLFFACLLTSLTSPFWTPALLKSWSFLEETLLQMWLRSNPLFLHCLFETDSTPFRCGKISWTISLDMSSLIWESIDARQRWWWGRELTCFVVWVKNSQMVHQVANIQNHTLHVHSHLMYPVIP